jgi:hypothetical protein
MTDKLSAIDAVQVPDDTAVRYMRRDPKCLVEVEVLTYIDTLRDLLKREGANKETLSDAYALACERFRKAESKLAAIELELARLNGEIPYGN